MINREIVYERNVTGSFMRIAAPAEGGVDERLILRRKLPGVLSMEKVYVNGGGQYWYNISGKQSLDTYCRMKEIGRDFVEQLIISICSLMERLEWNLVCTNCLILDPELIFINNVSREFVFTLYPGVNQKVEQEFQMMMEYLMKKVDHKDTQAVRIVYQLYEHTMEDGYQMMDMRNILFSEKNESRQEEIRAHSVTDPAFPIQERMSEDSAAMERRPDFGKGSPKDDNNERANGFNIFNAMKTKLIEWGILQGTEKAQNITKREFAGKTNHEKHVSGGRKNKRIKSEVVYPDRECDMELEPMPEIHPTVCLNSYSGQPKGELRYTGSEGYADISLKEDSVQIGYGKDADININRETISQLHARIHKEQDGFYIEDLNSTNGTFVNEEPLVYKEQRKLMYNDIVQFADIRYRFC